MEHVPAGLYGRCRTLDQFITDHAAVWEHSVMQQFLSDPRCLELLVQAICTPTLKNRTLLNEAFSSFYTEIRFTSYILKTLHWRAVRYDQQKQQRNTRQPLILDKPIHQGELETVGDSFVSSNTLYSAEQLLETFDLWQTIGHPLLYKALHQLTDHQHTVLRKKYVENRTDKAIAVEWNISQQAVYKTRQAALKKLRMFMKRGNSRC